MAELRRTVRNAGFAGSRTQLSGNINGLAVDGRGFVYVALACPNSVNAYGPRANGDVAPTRVIGGPATGIVSPDGIAAGGSGVYVTSTVSGHIARFARGAGGNVPPRSRLLVNWCVA